MFVLRLIKKKIISGVFLGLENRHRTFQPETWAYNGNEKPTIQPAKGQGTLERSRLAGYQRRWKSWKRRQTLCF